MSIWLSGWTHISLGMNGGRFQDTANPKGCLHTTEGSSLNGAEAAYFQYPPHMGYNPVQRIKHQYIPLNLHSYAFRGDESDNEYVIQVEIVGFASKTHLWNDQIYNNIAEDVIKPLEDAIGIPRKALKFYGDMDGIVLASKRSPIRLQPNSLRNYSGWLGHQHIPSPDEHWDPGKLLIDKCFSFLEPVADLERKKSDVIEYIRGNSTVKDSNNTPYGYRVFKVNWAEGTSVWVNDNTPGLLAEYRLWQACGNQVKVVEQSTLDEFNRTVNLPKEISK